MKRLAQLSPLLLLSLSGCAQLPFELPPVSLDIDTSTPHVKANAYVVRHGDTVASIAWRYQIASSDLVVWNNLQRPYDLTVGQALRVNGNRSRMTPLPAARPSVTTLATQTVQAAEPLISSGQTKPVAQVEVLSVSINPEPAILAANAKESSQIPLNAPPNRGETVLRAGLPTNPPVRLDPPASAVGQSPVVAPVSDDPSIVVVPASSMPSEQPITLGSLSDDRPPSAITVIDASETSPAEASGAVVDDAAPIIIASIDDQTALDRAPQITLDRPAASPNTAPTVAVQGSSGVTQPAREQDQGVTLSERAQAQAAIALSDWVWPAQGDYAHHQSAITEKGLVLDIQGVRGQAVMAAADGVVSYIGGPSPIGRVVFIEHPDGFLSAYSHNEQVRVEVSQRVSAGEIIAFMGGSGDGLAKLRFQLKKEGQAVDPLAYLPRINQ